MPRFSGIYLHFEGSTAECDAAQLNRELVWDTTSGMARYRNDSGVDYYLGAGGGESYWTLESSGYIMYSGETFTQARVVSPGFSGLMLWANGDVDQGGVTTDGTLILCGGYFYLNTPSGSVARGFDDELRIINEKKLTFGQIGLTPGNETFDIYTTGGSFKTLVISGLNYDEGIKLYSFNLTLETWSGDIDIVASGGAHDIKLRTLGDVYTTPWQSYAATASGWHNGYTATVYYKTLGKFVFINYSIDGSGNGNETMIQLPYPVDNNNIYMFPIVAGSNINSTHTNHSGATVRLSGSYGLISTDGYRTSSVYGLAGGEFDTKWLCGQFWYQRV